MKNIEAESTPTRRASPGDLPFQSTSDVSDLDQSSNRPNSRTPEFGRGGKARAWQILAFLPKALLAGLLILAILDMLAGVGLLAAIYGWKLAALNSVLLSPALEINLGWLYLSAAVGGALIAIYAAGIALGLIERKAAAIEAL